MKKLIATAALAVVVGSTAIAQQQKAPVEATTFATKVAASNAFAIQSSQLAGDRAERGEVKSFAKQMIDDHTKVGQDFKLAVQAANMSAPPEDPDAQQKAEIEKLQNARGRSFDQAYVSAQRQAHEEAVSLFRAYTRNGAAGPLKEFAQKTLPTLEQHLKMIQDVSQQISAAGQARAPAPNAKTTDAPKAKAAKEPARSRTAQKDTKRNDRVTTAQPTRRAATKASKKKRHARSYQRKKAYTSQRRKHRYARHTRRHHARAGWSQASYRVSRGACCRCWCCSAHYRLW
jgi:putative membrane protein